jgi:hypothetical protein
VTPTTIRIALPEMDAGAKQAPLLQPIVDFINSHFQLYGRRLVLVPYAAKGSRGAQHSDAQAAAQSAAFATMDYVASDGYAALEDEFLASVAAQHMLGVRTGREWGESGLLDSHAPFLWSYAPTLGNLESAAADVICRQLAHHPATHSAEYPATERVFAALVPDDKWMGQSPSTRELKDGLDACGVKLRVATYSALGVDQTASDQQQMLQLQSDGVTTVIYLSVHCCIPDQPPHSASSVGYHPEWFLLGQVQDDEELTWAAGAPSDQLRSMFGLAPWSRPVVSGDDPTTQVYAAQNARTKQSAANNAAGAYHELLLLASGIQSAGPRLTPATFQAGLQALRFPNPGAASAPYFQATVGFDDGRHTMTSDYALAWWNVSARSKQSVDGAHGAFCYVDRARRWLPGQFPDRDSFFDAASSAC